MALLERNQNGEKTPEANSDNTTSNLSSIAQPFIERGQQLLGVEQFSEANEFFDKALDYDSQSVSALLGKLLIEYEVTSIEDLGKLSIPIDDNMTLAKLLAVCDDRLKKELLNACDKIKENQIEEQAEKQKKPKLIKKITIISLLAIVCIFAIVFVGVLMYQTTDAYEFEFVEVDGGYKIIRYFGDDNIVIVPEEYDGLPVIEIGERAFSSSDSVTEITVPESVKLFEYYAFSDCINLKVITIPFIPEETSDAAYLFYFSGSPIEKVIITGDRDIPNIAFEGYTGLTEIVLSGSIKSIGEGAFYSCTSLTEITLPDGLESIGTDAFGCCTGLTEITFNENLVSIGNYAFCGCTGLTEITLPDSLESIGNGVFALCAGLTEITFNENLVLIGDCAFLECAGLTEITLPDGLESIGNDAFGCCTGITAVTLPDGLESIGNRAFSDCTSLKNIFIPKSVSSIGGYAFSLCRNLTIYCEAKSEPLDWSNGWSYGMDGQVYWGQSR